MVQGHFLYNHEDTGALATVTAVHPPARFGALAVEDGMVTHFREKPEDSVDRINGGFLVVEPACAPPLPPSVAALFHPPASRNGAAIYIRRVTTR